jgi:hypothetical protein
LAPTDVSRTAGGASAAGGTSAGAQGAARATGDGGLSGGPAASLGGRDASAGDSARGGTLESGAAGSHAGSSSQVAKGGAAQGGSSGSNAFGGAPQAGGATGGAAGAGKSGAGGMPATTPFCTPAVVIDDMEDGDALTCANQGRQGDWWTAAGTMTGAIDPRTDVDFPAFPLGSDARPGSNYGMRFSGTDFGHTEDDWAQIGFFLAGESAYDLTPYTGLTFYAKSRAAPIKVHVEFATTTTTPTVDGGSCATNCNDHFEAIVALSGDWQEFTLPFASLAQEGWGPKPKDLAHTIFVYFGFLGTDGGPSDFDFLVDDISLY